MPVSRGAPQELLGNGSIGRGPPKVTHRGSLIIRLVLLCHSFGAASRVASKDIEIEFAPM